MKCGNNKLANVSIAEKNNLNNILEEPSSENMQNYGLSVAKVSFS